MFELGHALQCVFLSNTLWLLYFLMFAPFFTRGMQTGELFGLLSNRSGSLSTKLVTESKADVIFPNIFSITTGSYFVSTVLFFLRCRRVVWGKVKKFQGQNQHSLMEHDN